jgi:hypothetical protein
VVSPPAKRAAVRVAREEARLSERAPVGCCGCTGELPLSAEGTQRCGAGNAAGEIQGNVRASGTGECIKCCGEVDGKSQAGVSELPGGRAGDAAQETQAISG